MNENKIKILLVDSDLSFLNNVKNKIKTDYNDNLEALIFNQDIGEIEDTDIGQSFIYYILKNRNKNIADVIFCSNNLKTKIVKIIKDTSDIKSRPPIVIITDKHIKKYQLLIDSITAGAKGYIQKNNIDFFIKELLLTSIRVSNENQTIKTHKIIAEVSRKYSRDDVITDINDLAQHFVEVFNEYYPYNTIIIRKYENDSLTLISSNISDKNLEKSIQKLNIEDTPILKQLMADKDGVIPNIDLKDLTDKNIQEAVSKLKIQKGVMIRIGERAMPLASISIFSHEPKRVFNQENIDNFKLTIDSIDRTWQLIHTNTIRKEALEFIKEITNETDSSKIWKLLGEIIHKHYNKDSQKTTTIIKLFNPLNNSLDYEYCHGERCENSTISIDDADISAWVFRNRLFCIVNKRSFTNDKKLTNEFKTSLTKNYIDKDINIEYKSLNREYKSQLCIPIISENESIGVLDLHSPQYYAYPKKKVQESIIIKEQIEYLIQITTSRIKNIEQNKFMDKILIAISQSRYEQRFKEASKFLANFSDYYTFSIILKNRDKLKVKYFSFNPSLKYKKEWKVTQRELEEVINNKNNAIKSFIKENTENKYIYDSSKVKNFCTIPSLDSKSQFISKLIFKGELLGVVNFSFNRINPLNNQQINILEKFIAWLGRDIQENIEREKIKFINKKDSIDSIFRNLNHLMNTPISLARSQIEIVKTMLSDKNLSDNKIDDRLDRSREILETISNYPKRYISSSIYSYKTIKEAYDSVYEDLKYKRAEKSHIELIDKIEYIKIPPKLTSSLYLIIFHPLLNALEEDSVTKIEVIGKKEDNIISITISDNGAGFKHQDIEANKTTKSDGGGFGLYYIKQLIEFELDGKLNIDSNTNGANITIKFELREENSNEF